MQNTKSFKKDYKKRKQIRTLRHQKIFDDDFEIAKNLLEVKNVVFYFLCNRAVWFVDNLWDW